MNAAKTSLCPCCEEGHLRTVTRDFVADIGEGQKLRIPGIEMEVCDKCDAEILSLNSARLVDEAVAEHTDRLSPDEIREIREQFGLNRTEMSEALGLGSKTWLRWEQGTQYPSRSMGYYLRLLRQFPEAFKWLNERAWKGRNRINNPEEPPILELQRQFPVLAQNPGRLNHLMTNRRNPARLFSFK